MWLDDVFVPWERVFLSSRRPSRSPPGCFWHHLYGWLAKAEFTLGLALALADAMGLKEHQPTIEYLVDLVTDVQTVRSLPDRRRARPGLHVGGYCIANHTHLLPAASPMLKARQRMAEILRIVPGSSLVVAPSDSDLADPEMAAGLEEIFGGGGYTANSAPPCCSSPPTMSPRPSTGANPPSSCTPAAASRLARPAAPRFQRYNELANAVLRAIDIPMPEIDVGVIPAAPLAPRRPNMAPPSAGKPAG